MRRSMMLMLIVSLALGAGQVCAQPSQPAFSADGLYNLGNAYARAGKPGLAVLSYERAALLAPQDADINANLAGVRAAAQVSIQPRNRLTRLVQAMSPTAAAWLGVLGVALLGIGLVSSKMAQRRLRILDGGILLGALLIALSAGNAMLLWPRMHEAIVLVDQTPVRVSPAPMADTAFVLREADSVTMTAEHEDFVFIRSRNGSSGWVARASLGAVVPPVNGESAAATR